MLRHRGDDSLTAFFDGDRRQEQIAEESRSRHKRFGVLLRNQLYAGIVDVPEYGVRAKRGDFRAADFRGLVLPRAGGAVRSRAEHDAAAARAPGLPTPRVRTLRILGRGLTASWSKGLGASHPKCRFAKARPEPDFR